MFYAESSVDYILDVYCVIVLRRFAKLALQALYMLRQIRSSVSLSVCPSLFGNMCQNQEMQRDAVFTSGTPGSLFSDAKNGCWGRPCPGKIWVKRGRPPAKTTELYKFSLITPKL